MRLSKVINFNQFRIKEGDVKMLKPYYEQDNWILSRGKIYFEKGKDINVDGAEYLWTLDKGVYGIFEGEELIYIGETMRNFETRMREHNQAMNNKSSISKMYKYINENFEEKKFYMRPLVELGIRMWVDRPLTQAEVYAIELGFITCFRPKFNRAGETSVYRMKNCKE